MSFKTSSCSALVRWRARTICARRFRSSSLACRQSHAASLVSCGSLRRLAEQAERSGLDARRFRMLIEIDGVAPYEEDGWVDSQVRVGPALLRMRGHVGRCLITSRDPETAAVDLPTLDLLARYRREVQSTEPLPFGIYGEVLEGGSVQLGDAVAVGEPAAVAAER